MVATSTATLPHPDRPISTNEPHPGPRGRSVSALAIAVAAVLGVLGGLGAFTFGYGDGAAYMTNDPEACTQCHVMQEQYDSWIKSGHAHVATCNDCHLPHHNVEESELRAKVDAIQDRTVAVTERAAEAMTSMLDAILEAQVAGATDEALAPVYDLQRKAMWRLDYIRGSVPILVEI